MMDERPLLGRTVLVTRPVDQAGRLGDVLSDAGATPLEIPTIAIEPPATWDPVDATIAQGGYDWVVFTSANGVTAFLERLAAAGADQSWWRVTRVAAVGPRTAGLLRQAGIRVDVVPDEFVADALVATLAHDEPLNGRRVLFPGAERARDTVDQGLREHGAIVDRVTVYRTVPAPIPRDLNDHLQNRQIDAATFTSASTVTSLLDMLGSHAQLLAGVVVACIGPVTADAARARGLSVDVVAEQHTIPGLVEALSEFYRARAAAQQRAGRH
jgi:uroporphyrinogen III methyltransferase / synthase